MAKVNKVLSYAFGLLGGLGVMTASPDVKAQNNQKNAPQERTVPEDETHKAVGFDKQLADTLLPYAFIRAAGDDLFYERIVYMGDSAHIYQTDEQWKAKTTLFTLRVNDRKQVAIWAEDRDNTRTITEDKILQVIEDVADINAGIVRRKTATLVPGVGYQNLCFEMDLKKGTTFYDMNDYLNNVPSMKVVNSGLPPTSQRALDIFLKDDVQPEAAAVAKKSKKQKKADVSQPVQKNEINNVNSAKIETAAAAPAPHVETPVKEEPKADLTMVFAKDLKNIALEKSSAQCTLIQALYSDKGAVPMAFIDARISSKETISVNADERNRNFSVDEGETVLLEYIYEGTSKSARLSVTQINNNDYSVALYYAQNAALAKATSDEEKDKAWKPVDISQEAANAKTLLAPLRNSVLMNQVKKLVL